MLMASNQLLGPTKLLGLSASGFTLNTIQIPSLEQVLVALPGGLLFDFLNQQAGGAVRPPVDKAVADMLRALKVNGYPVFIES